MKLNLSLSIVMGTLLWASASLLSAADEPWMVYAARKITSPPVIDGRLDDPCWQGLERTSPFTCIGGAAAPIVTTGMACWDAKTLYIAFSCGEPMIAAIMKRKADGILAPFADSVEMFFDVEESHFSCAQLRVDFAGVRDTRPQAGDLDAALNLRWNAAVSMDRDRWIVEAAIPFDVLKSPQPDEKTVWGLNLNRARSISAAGGWTCWSDTKGPFLAPHKFGHLVFFPYQVFLQNHIAAELKSIGNDLDQLRRRSAAANGKYGPVIEVLQKECAEFIKALETTPPADGQAAAACRAKGVALLHKMETFYNEAYLRVIGGSDS